MANKKNKRSFKDEQLYFSNLIKFGTIVVIVLVLCYISLEYFVI